MLLCLSGLAASARANAHLLNMTKVVVNIHSDEQLSVDMQVDLSRAAGGQLEYYRLSRVDAPLQDAGIQALMNRLVQAVDLRADGRTIPLQLKSIDFPKLPEEQFLDPLSWPMTHVVLSTTGGEQLHAIRGMQGVLRPAFPFEEPISLTFSLESEQRTMTRWLVAGQTSPTFRMHEGLVVESAAAAPSEEETTPLSQYLVFGFMHILPKGLDHVLFVLGLYLGARSFKSLLILVTSFTVAHSITLALASIGAVRLPADIVEPLIAASIVWIGIENVFLQRSERWRPLIIFVFGQLHGLGFASVLSELRLPADSFLLALLTFNVGIELGQLAVIALALAVTAAFRQKTWYRARVSTPASIAIAALAALWTVERIV